MRLAERARPRAQQAPPAPTRWIFPTMPLALDAAAPEDGVMSQRFESPNLNFFRLTKGINSVHPRQVRCLFSPSRMWQKKRCISDFQVRSCFEKMLSTNPINSSKCYENYCFSSALKRSDSRNISQWQRQWQRRRPGRVEALPLDVSPRVSAWLAKPKHNLINGKWVPAESGRDVRCLQSR